jgi:hypothetical protein
MIYALITYLIFLALFQQWGGNSVNCQVIYFAGQYAFAGSVAGIEAVRGKSTAYLAICLIFCIIIVNELSYINSSPEIYATVWTTAPVYLFTAFIIVAFLVYEIITKWKTRLNGRSS